MNTPTLVISQAEARKTGLKRYFTGRFCARHHLAHRHTHNGVCVECGKENDTRRYAEKGSQLRAEAVRRYWENPEVHREKKRIERATHGEKLRLRDRKRYRLGRGALPEENQPPSSLVSDSATLRPGSKLCRKCGTVKTKSLFAKHRNRADEVQVYCFKCMAALRHERQYDKRRWADNTTRQLELERHRQYINANKEYWLEYGRLKSREQRLKSPGAKKQANILRQYAGTRATSRWADLDKINAIYIEARLLTSIDGILRNVDHIIPLRNKLVCGLHVENNLQILTKLENEEKHNKFTIETTIFMR
jgi:hypothetical protein